MVNFLNGIHKPINGVPQIAVDNQSSLSLTETTTHHARTKHFDTNWAWIRDVVREGELAF
ncbi:hypothetical protein F5880DRAFT_1491631 [Lentinula raphanica]|nr:hypothetical protein F5880DRAFT_1491631 [Lentinula raphanica]